MQNLVFIKKIKLLIWLLAIGLVLGTYTLVYQHGSTHHISTTRFAQLAQAFTQGHTYFLTPPAPGLLALPNPFDPYANQKYRLQGVHDMSLYHDKMYMYYGPTSALLLAGLSYVGITHVTDNILVLFWSCALAFSLAVIVHFFSNKDNVTTLLGYPRTHSPAISFPLSIISYLFVALNIGTLTCLARPLFYEAAITSAAFFFWSGIAVMLYAISHLQTDNRSIKTKALFLSCGLLFALSFLSRYSYAVGLFAIFFVMLMICFSRKKYVYFSLFTLPFVVVALSLFMYNEARFGSLFETGFTFVLAGFNQFKVLIDYGTFNIQNFLANTYFHFFRSFAIADQFPFIIYTFDRIPEWLGAPYYYSSSYMIGLFWTQLPIYVIAYIFLVLPMRIQQHPVYSYYQLGIASLCLFAIQIFHLLFFFNSGSRFVVDYIFALSIGLVLLGIAFRDYVRPLIVGMLLSIGIALMLSLNNLG